MGERGSENVRTFRKRVKKKDGRQLERERELEKHSRGTKREGDSKRWIQGDRRW